MSATLLLLAALGTVADDGRDVLVRCAWDNMATTASTLLSRVKFDSQYVYDADGSPTVGPLMRIWAACATERAALDPSQRKDIRGFLKRLRGARPKAIAADRFDTPVYRCEFRFRDEPGKVAGVGWGYGPVIKDFKLLNTSEIYGVEFGALDLGSKPKDEVATIRSLLDSVSKIEPAEVTTFAEGKRLGKPFIVSKNDGERSCKTIGADGNYANA